MSNSIAGIQIPDSALAKATTEYIRDVESDLLYHHSRRVFLFGALSGERKQLAYNPELLYVGAMFHDLGLTTEYGTKHQRFEIDGADLARKLLLDFGRSEQDATNVWLAIALHTTPEVPHHLAPEVAVVIMGVETDVIGLGLDEISDRQRAEVVAAHPRPDFKNRILQAFNAGMVDRPLTTFGTMNDDVLAHFDPSFERINMVDLIQGNAWPE